MSVTCSYRSIQDLAVAVVTYGRVAERRHFSAYPWNRFQPGATQWYCVPSTEYPSYRFGKGFFGKMAVNAAPVQERLLCGLYVEKGLDPITVDGSSTARYRGLVLDRNWRAWPRLLESLSDGSVAQVATAVGANVQQKVVLRVDSWYVTDRTDPSAPPGYGLDDDLVSSNSNSAGRVWFEVSTDGELQILGLPERIRTAMEPVVASHSLAELASALGSGSELTWCWVNVHIGTWLAVSDRVSTQSLHLSAGEVWRLLVKPWLPWII